MTNNDHPSPKRETFTWLEPGVWRKPCIVHVTMVANGRQSLFGVLSHDGNKAVVEKTPMFLDSAISYLKNKKIAPLRPFSL